MGCLIFMRISILVSVLQKDRPNPIQDLLPLGMQKEFEEETEYLKSSKFTVKSSAKSSIITKVRELQDNGKYYRVFIGNIRLEMSPLKKKI